MKINVKGVIVPNDDKWVYDYFGMESTSPKEVQDALDKAMGQVVDVEINSGGGDIFAGSEIYTALRNYAGKVAIRIVGLAASSASVIAMAGTSEMSPTSMLMVHNVSSYAAGDYHDMDKQSEVLQKANQSIAAAYSAKAGMTEKEALTMMDKETWLTAQQAVDMKLIDRVMFKDVKLAASYQSGMLPQSVINKIKSDNPSKKADFLSAKLNLLKVKENKND